MTGEGFEEAAEAGEEDGSVHGKRESGGGGPFVLHHGLLALQRNLHPTDAREP